MINILSILITLAIVGQLLIKKKNFLDFRVFMLMYFLFFYQLSFYSYYFIEQKIDFSFVENIGLINFIVIFAYLFSLFILKLNLFKNYKYRVIYSYNRKREFFINLAIFLFILLILAIYYYRAGTFPIFLTSIEDGRIELASHVSGFVIVLLQFVFVLFVLLMSKSFFYKKYFFIFFILLVSISFWLLMASKRPVAGLLLMFLIFLTYQRKKISNISIFVSIVIILLFVVTYGSFRLFGNFELENMLKILTAIFNAEMFNLSLVLQNPPPLQYGQTYLNAILMIFTDVKDIGTILKEYYGLTFLGGGITIGIIGEGYINFSYIGVFFESVLFWFIVILLAKRMEKKSLKKDYFSIGKYTFYFYFILWVFRNGFFAVITPLFYFIIFEVITFLVRKRVVC